jgi:hypothetical protein
VSPTKRASTVANLRNAVAAGGPQAATLPAPVVPEAAASAESGNRPGPPPRPPKPIRFTLDLNKDRHTLLKRFAADAEVDCSTVMRILLDHLHSDEQLAQRVREAAWADQ